MANRRYSSQFRFSFHHMPVSLDCNFVVDSANPNGLGLRSLKTQGIASVTMQSVQAPAGSPPAFNSSLRQYGILGASAVTNTGASVVNGNLGLYPGTSVTGFPPGVITGAENIANVAAQNAQISALAAYNDMHARTFTPISSTLDGQTLTPGNYSESSGTFNLAASGNGTLTLNGAGIYIFKAASTLVTGAGGIPTILLTGGAQASNVYWLVGSSATINSGSAGTFQGNILAVSSITDSLGGTVNGSLIALNGAVTLSAATISNAQPIASSNGIAAGYMIVRFSDEYNRYIDGFSGQVSPLSGSSISSGMTVGNPYVIVSVGSSTPAQWQAAGLPSDQVPAVGQAFIAAATSVAGGGLVQAVTVSGIDHIEVVGDPNTTLASTTPGKGGYMILQCLFEGIPTAPTDGTVIGLDFQMSNSSLY
jgi:hypothetical protein